MVPVLYLMLVLSAVATVDVLYFHIWKYRLYRVHACRWEVLTHAGHGFAAVGVFGLCVTRAHGQWAWLTVGVLGFQVVNQTLDTLLEPASRRGLGGIPEDEYRMHGVINFLWGAIITLGLMDAWRCMSLPDALGFEAPGVPALLAPAPYTGMAGAAAMALFDLAGFVSLVVRRPSAVKMVAQP